MSKETHERAFPVALGSQSDQHHADPGMTLRDYAAIKAMQAFIIANPIYGTPEGNVSNSRAAISDRAYQMADAMLLARSQPHD